MTALDDLIERLRLRYRLWRLDQAEKMTATRAAWIVGLGSVAGFAIITALLHLPTGQYIAAVATYAAASYGGIRAGIGIARDFVPQGGPVSALDDLGRLAEPPVSTPHAITVAIAKAIQEQGGYYDDWEQDGDRWATLDGDFNLTDLARALAQQFVITERSHP